VSHASLESKETFGRSIMADSMRLAFTILAGWICLAGPRPAAALTLEEAEALSQQTGRPVFAVAGTES
jgi:hypothetical protein